MDLHIIDSRDIIIGVLFSILTDTQLEEIKQDSIEFFELDERNFILKVLMNKLTYEQIEEAKLRLSGMGVVF